MTTIHKYLFSLLTAFLVLPTFVFSQTGEEPVTVELQNPLIMDSLEDLLIAILDLIMVLMIPVIVFFIIFAGFKYVTARGNANTIGEATRALTYAVIGGVIILGAVAISQMIKSTVDEFRAEEADPEDPIPRRETDPRRDRDPEPDPDRSPWDGPL